MWAFPEDEIGFGVLPPGPAVPDIQKRARLYEDASRLQGEAVRAAARQEGEDDPGNERPATAAAAEKNPPRADEGGTVL